MCLSLSILFTRCCPKNRVVRSLQSKKILTSKTSKRWRWDRSTTKRSHKFLKRTSMERSLTILMLTANQMMTRFKKNLLKLKMAKSLTTNAQILKIVMRVSLSKTMKKKRMTVLFWTKFSNSIKRRVKSKSWNWMPKTKTKTEKIMLIKTEKMILK